MNYLQKLLITNATVRAGSVVMMKSASASQEQTEVLNAVWPSDGEQNKVAALSRILAAGAMVEEAEAELAGVGG